MMKLPVSLKFLILCAIVTLAITRSWYGTQLDSFTVDEPYHVVAGVSYVQTGDFRLNPEHPPLTKLWVGMFNNGLFGHEPFKLREYKPLYDKYNERNFTEETMYEDNNYQRAQQLSRWAMWSFNGLLMLCLMGLLWRLVGFHAAWLVGVLIAIEPTMAAHMPVVMTDLPVALALGCTVLVAVGLARHWSFRWMVLLMVFSAIALASKFSAITGLLAVFFTLAFYTLFPWLKKQWQIGFVRLGMVLFSGIMAVLLLWATYGFNYHSSPDGSDQFNRSLENKVADLSSPGYQKILTLLDQSHVLPRAFIWGLADTVKAGVEGRGDPENFIFGHMYKGSTPWFYWPAVMVSKTSIAMQALLLFLLFYGLWRRLKARNYDHPHDRSNNDLSIFLASLFAFYFLTLLTSQGTYAGIRHALPLLLLLLIGGACVYQQTFKNHPRMINSILVAGLLLTFLTTISEKRLWEYHSEWVGGSENAHQYFANEGLNLGQRADEVFNYIKNNHLENEELYIGTWMITEHIKAEGINDSKVAKNIYDDNVDGKYAGYHLMEVNILIEWEHWDPQKIDHWERVKRFGHVYLFKGSVEDPEAWASSIKNRIREHLMTEKTPDWATIAKRLEQVISIKDYQSDTHLQLANAYVQTGQKDKAIASYQKAYDLIDESKKYRNKIKKQIQLIENTEDIKTIELLRSDNVE